MDTNTNGPGPGSGRERHGGPARAALRIVLTYAIVATLWILFSDALVRALTVDPNLLTRVAIAKGALFVAVTSALLFFQIRDDFARLRESSDRLRESEERFRRVVEVSPVPMTMRDQEDNVTLVNAAFVKSLGYTRDEIPTLAEWWSLAYPDPEYRKSIIATWEREVERSRVAGDSFVPYEVRVRCKDGNQRTMLVSAAPLGTASAEEVVVYWDITERERAEAEVLRSNERLERVLKSVTGLIGKVVEARDPYTQGHEEGVARIGRLIAQEMGLSPDEVDGIEVAGLVHDVGKLSIPAEILTKPGQLSPVERELIKGHSQRGNEILSDIDFDWPVAETVRQHHERMDGSGYPNGLAGNEISVAARILMAADVIEAMGAHRPYRPALGLEAAMAEITGHPEQFDPEVTAAAVRLYRSGQLAV